MWVRNTTQRTLVVPGARIAPGQEADVDVAKDDPFVKEGWLAVAEKPKSRSKPKASEADTGDDAPTEGEG